MIEKLVELGEKGLTKEEIDARNFRAKLLGLIYEDLLMFWFKNMRYNIVGRDVRKGVYENRRVAVDFILEKNGVLYVVEAKCWPAYLEGRLKKITLENIEKIKKKVGVFLNDDFVDKYSFDNRKVDAKILIWWDLDEADIEEIKRRLKLSDLISIKKILGELRGKADHIVMKYMRWTEELFKALVA